MSDLKFVPSGFPVPISNFPLEVYTPTINNRLADLYLQRSPECNDFIEFACCPVGVSGVRRILAQDRNFLERLCISESGVVTQIVSKSNVWYPFCFNENVSRLDIEEQSDNAGKLFNITIAAQADIMTPLNRESLIRLSNRNLVIILEDNNDNYWLIGTDGNVQVKNIKGTTGAGLSDNNNYNWVMVGSERCLPKAVDFMFVDSLELFQIDCSQFDGEPLAEQQLFTLRTCTLLGLIDNQLTPQPEGCDALQGFFCGLDFKNLNETVTFSQIPDYELGMNFSIEFQTKLNMQTFDATVNSFNQIGNGITSLPAGQNRWILRYSWAPFIFNNWSVRMLFWNGLTSRETGFVFQPAMIPPPCASGYYHCIMVCSSTDPNDFKIFINGVEIEPLQLLTPAFLATMANNSGLANILARPLAHSALGLPLGGLRIYNYRLDLAEAQALYNNGIVLSPTAAGIDPADVVLNCEFNEASGIAATETVFGNNGVLSNFGTRTNSGGNAWTCQ